MVFFLQKTLKIQYHIFIYFPCRHDIKFQPLVPIDRACFDEKNKYFLKNWKKKQKKVKKCHFITGDRTSVDFFVVSIFKGKYRKIFDWSNKKFFFRFFVCIFFVEILEFFFVTFPQVHQMSLKNSGSCQIEISKK